MFKPSKIYVSQFPDPNSDQGRKIYVIDKLINVADYSIGDRLTAREVKDLLEFSLHNIIITAPK